MNSIKIDIIDNGYILSYVKTSALDGSKKLLVVYIESMKDISELLNKEYK